MKELPELSHYRPNIGICVLNKKGQVWLGQRVPPKNANRDQTYRWQLPQGGMDRGETPEQTARRELFEETGLRSARLLMMTPGWLVYDFPPDYRQRKGDKWQGQRQKWALMLFEGDDSEVDLQAEPPQEFCDWRWAELSEIADLIVPFKRGIYRAVVEAFTPMAQFIADQYRD
ncbi:RNA pyrophosphohydrolase [Parvularcula sp. LCG005]|uniref:RNA pyrophosphohydrolase n=1 Tax=Parvularcula sp. LCG005 TaxID=3078805 RepID=UPI0029428603|nr:RNA pyrophosphohydrolase [Parvularcula sp. LCG005]WOI53099.1 RNA pyrophosphohydrolase [Parvularcula sp. LCG005]